MNKERLGNILDQRLKAESPLGSTLERRREDNGKVKGVMWCHFNGIEVSKVSRVL